MEETITSAKEPAAEGQAAADPNRAAEAEAKQGPEAEAAQAAAEQAGAAQAQERPSFETLIREQYRDDYLKCLEKALLTQARETDRYLAYRELRRAAEQVKQIHPEFDLSRQMKDPSFARLVRNGVEPGLAYEAILAQARADERAALERNAARPVENGLGRSAAAVVRPDPRAMTPAERRALERRAARGEEIVF